MVSPRPPNRNSSSPHSKPLGIVPSALITIGITVIFLVHSFLSSLARFKYLSLSLRFLRISLSTVHQDGRVHNSGGSFFSCFLFYFILFYFLFLFNGTMSGLLASMWWSVCTSKSQITLCVSFSRRNSGLCIYHLVLWSFFNFLHNSQWITFPTQPCLVFYFFGSSLLHSLIMWLIFSSLSPHNIHLLFCCVLSIFVLT